MAVGSRYYVDEGGAAGDGTTDDAAAIQGVLDQAATDAAPVIFGPKTYGVATRLIPRQGSTLIFEGSTIRGLSGLPTSGDTSALIDIDGSTTGSVKRGIHLTGVCDFDHNNIALYGVLLGGGQSRGFIEGHPFRSINGVTSAIRMYNGGWWGTTISGWHVSGGQMNTNSVVFDLLDNDGTTVSVRDSGVLFGPTPPSGSIGFRLEGNSFELSNCYVDGSPSDGVALELAANNLGAQVEAINMHFEGIEGIMVKTVAGDRDNAFKWRGGLFHLPSGANPAHVLELGTGTSMILEDIRYQTFTDFSNFADIASGAILEVRGGVRDLSASAPFNSFTGAGEAFQIWEGRRVNLHNSPN